MTKPAKKKAASKSAKAKAPPTWTETMKQALQKKGSANQGPNQPKPRDSGTFKVKKDAF